MSWQLKIRTKAWKALLKLPSGDRSRLLQVIEELPRNPYTGDIDKMKGEIQSWRRRVGAYRIFYEVVTEDKVVYVFRIERRTSKTY